MDRSTAMKLFCAVALLLANRLVDTEVFYRQDADRIANGMTCDRDRLAANIPDDAVNHR